MKPNLLIVTLLFVACHHQSKTEAVATDSKDTSKPAAVQTAKSSTPATKAVANNIPFVYGIDISKYQGDEIEFIQKKGDTLTFVICKATEGLSSIDPDFKNNWKTIDEKGFVRGAYHFYHCIDDPKKQAAHFVSTVDSFEAEDFPPIIDFEEASVSKNCSAATIQQNLLTFLKEVELRTGRKPLIYTDNNTGGKYLNIAAFVDYPLFIADYSKGNSPKLPGAWKNKQWALWQKSESYVMHSTTDDFDIFNGSPAELSKFISSH